MPHKTTLAIIAVFLVSLALEAGSCAQTLTQARAKFSTTLVVHRRTPGPVDIPPEDSGLQLISYKAPQGMFPAYISTPPNNGGRAPAIIWIFGGFDNGIDNTAWAPQDADNDQSASVFRQFGILTMYPSLRGGNRNPGYIENFYGEVNDIIAAYRYLAAQPFVDTNRIYLGGHSTGGTLALLVAESTPAFRAVFSFGPVASVAQYGSSDLTFNYQNQTEIKLRSPILFLKDITKPTVILEGDTAPSNIEPFNELKQASRNPKVHFYVVTGYDHFSELSQSTQMVANWIRSDSGSAFQYPVP